MMTETAQQLGVERYSVRKPDRIRIILNTKLRLPGQPDMDVVVRNISSRGFTAEADRDPPIGSDAMAHPPGICWSMATTPSAAGHRLCGRFSESVDMGPFWRAHP